MSEPSRQLLWWLLENKDQVVTIEEPLKTELFGRGEARMHLMSRFLRRISFLHSPKRNPSPHSKLNQYMINMEEVKVYAQEGLQDATYQYMKDVAKIAIDNDSNPQDLLELMDGLNLLPAPVKRLQLINTVASQSSPNDPACQDVRKPDGLSLV